MSRTDCLKEAFAMKKIFSGIVAASVVLTLAVSAYADANLTDVTPGSWFYNEVSEMVASGYIDGYEDGTFKPDRTVTIAEFVTMAARMAGAPTGEAEDYWGGLQMDHAYRSGWISESDVARGEYDVPVTRELACKIIAAALGLGYPAGTVLEFTDSGDIGSDYLGSVMALYANGLLDGYEDNTLRPQATLTRAQAATLLYRASHIGDEPEETAPAITAAGYTADQIINYFCDVALGAEYGDAGENVIKWVEPFTYYIEGESTDADLAQINALIEAINRVPGFPGMSEAGRVESADLTIHFVDADGIIAATGNSYNGYVNIWWSDYCIENGDIYYRTDITQELRNAVIVEELCQSLGLLTDTYDHPESIFYQYHTDTAWPTTLDWAVIQLLYRSEITPGMDEEAVREAAAALVG